MPEMTERQAQAWPTAIAELNRCADTSLPDRIGSWDVVWGEETRPGRGHHVNATYNDGEHFAQILMDVYGYPSVSIAELTWVHASSDEECECHVCEADRESQDQSTGASDV